MILNITFQIVESANGDIDDLLTSNLRLRSLLATEHTISQHTTQYSVDGFERMGYAIT